jgi:hypothetical protein
MNNAYMSVALVFYSNRRGYDEPPHIRKDR